MTLVMTAAIANRRQSRKRFGHNLYRRDRWDFPAMFRERLGKYVTIMPYTVVSSFMSGIG